jgi:hypothetical protein
LHEGQKAFQKGSFYQTATPEQWIKTLREWSESHRRELPLLSDEAVSFRGIYEKEGACRFWIKDFRLMILRFLNFGLSPALIARGLFLIPIRLLQNPK